MSTETTNKKIKIDNGTTFGRTYTDKAVDAKLPTDLIASANKLSLGVGNAPLGSGVNLSGFTYDEATKTLKASGGGGSISVIELTGESGTIASAQLGEINANPQNFAFKYNGKILPFTKVDSTTHQYCNNTTNSSDNNVMTTSVLLTITSSTGAYTIAENVHNVVANSIHPANGGDLTNIQVGSKVYSIPSGGEGSKIAVIGTSSNMEGNATSYKAHWSNDSGQSLKANTAYEVGDSVTVEYSQSFNSQYLQENQIIVPYSSMVSLSYKNYKLQFGGVVLILTDSAILLNCSSKNNRDYKISAKVYLTYSVVKAGTTGENIALPSSGWDCTYRYIIYTLGKSVA